MRNLMRYAAGILIMALVLFVGGMQAATPQQSASVTQVAEGSVPRLVQFNGTLKDAAGRPVAGVASVTFAIYAEQDGGAALWSETQNVLADTRGVYSVLLGSATANGVPAELFGTGQSRWLGVTVARQAEMPRVLLGSVPYAMKASDADTLGGLPASAYVTAASLAASAPKGATVTTVVTSAGATTAAATPQAASAAGVTEATPTGSGTADYIPLWTSASNLGNSILFQTDSRIGVGTTTPQVTLDVNGDSIFRGSFQLVPQGTATASTGQLSHSYQWEASTYDSSTSAAVTTAFGFRATPVGNNTASPTSSLDLYYGPGGGTLTDTGFSFANNGIVTFAAGQTFPGVAQLGADNVFTTSQTVDGSLTAVYPGLGLYGVASNSSGTATGVEGESVSPLGYGVVGVSPNTGVYGASSGSSSLGVGRGKAGVWGDTGGGTGDGYIGVLGTADGNSAGGFYNNGLYPAVVAKNAGSGLGVEGKGSSYGIYGIAPSETTKVERVSTAGVWGDSAANVGVQGTSDSGTAGAFYSDGTQFTMFVTNESTVSPSPVIAAEGTSGASCTINGNGDLYCSGTIGTTEAVESGTRSLAVYSMESPENWMEDFGSAATTNGTATVVFEPKFAQTINAGSGYHVFITPNADCKGLYVTNKTAAGFEVHEMGGGVSSVAFDYRIVAKRAGFENVRLEDVTAQQALVHSQSKRLRRGATAPAGSTTSTPRSVAGTPVAAAPAGSVTARQLAAAGLTRQNKPVN